MWHEYNEPGVAHEGMNCNCGTIVIESEPIDSKDSQEFKELQQAFPNTTDIVENYIMKIHPKGIIVTSLDKVLLRTNGPSRFQLCCANCKMFFELLLAKNHLYVYEGEEIIDKKGSTETGTRYRTAKEFMPLSLIPFLTHKHSGRGSPVILPHITSELPKKFKLEDTSSSDSDECDYDIMFSNKNELVVGSFTPRWINMPNGIKMSGFDGEEHSSDEILISEE